MNSASGQEKSGEMKGSQKEIYWRTVLPDRREGSSVESYLHLLYPLKIEPEPYCLYCWNVKDL
jgi:hypothetical protein